MKLADLSTGPDWVVYVGFIIFAVLSIVLISGHGSWLISAGRFLPDQKVPWSKVQTS